VGWSVKYTDEDGIPQCESFDVRAEALDRAAEVVKIQLKAGRLVDVKIELPQKTVGTGV